jgi:hypothetical protein
MMTEEDYVSHDGSRCPVCSSDSIEAGRIGGESMSCEVECLSCGSTWLDVYTLVGYTDLLKGDLDAKVR